MKRFLSILFSLFVIQTFAQDTLIIDHRFVQKSNIQFEILGIGAVYSVSYERRFLNSDKFKTVGSIGLSFWGNDSWKGITMPISVTELFSFNRHHIEVGMSISPNFVSRTDNTKEWDQYTMVRVGYRYQRPSGRFVFRAGYTPIIYPEFGHWGGIAIGYCLRPIKL